jgi:hypothetical protein
MCGKWKELWLRPGIEARGMKISNTISRLSK